MSKMVKLKLSAAVVIDGGIYKAGREVEVSEEVAKNLLHRGRAVLAGDNVDLNEGNEKAARKAEEAAKAEAAKARAEAEAKAKAEAEAEAKAKAETEKAAAEAKSSPTPKAGKK